MSDDKSEASPKMITFEKMHQILKMQQGDGALPQAIASAVGGVAAAHPEIDLLMMADLVGSAPSPLRAPLVQGMIGHYAAVMGAKLGAAAARSKSSKERRKERRKEKRG